jgi:hypothetical protein
MNILRRFDPAAVADPIEISGIYMGVRKYANI